MLKSIGWTVVAAAVLLLVMKTSVTFVGIAVFAGAVFFIAIGLGIVVEHGRERSATVLAPGSVSIEALDLSPLGDIDVLYKVKAKVINCTADMQVISLRLPSPNRSSAQAAVIVTGVRIAPGETANIDEIGHVKSSAPDTLEPISLGHPVRSSWRQCFGWWASPSTWVEAYRGEPGLFFGFLTAIGVAGLLLVLGWSVLLADHGKTLVAKSEVVVSGLQYRADLFKHMDERVEVRITNNSRRAAVTNLSFDVVGPCDDEECERRTYAGLKRIDRQPFSVAPGTTSIVVLDALFYEADESLFDESFVPSRAQRQARLDAGSLADVSIEGRLHCGSVAAAPVARALRVCVD